EGKGVVELGLSTTDMVYFASGRLQLPGAMFTASHNPPRYNGLKLCLAGAAPVGQDTGLREIRERAEALTGSRTSGSAPRERLDLVHDYLDHLLSFIDVRGCAPLTVAADAANGMAGPVVPRLVARLP